MQPQPPLTTHPPLQSHPSLPPNEHPPPTPPRFPVFSLPRTARPVKKHLVTRNRDVRCIRLLMKRARLLRSASPSCGPTYRRPTRRPPGAPSRHNAPPAPDVVEHRCFLASGLVVVTAPPSAPSHPPYPMHFLFFVPAFFRRVVHAIPDTGCDANNLPPLP